MLLIPDPQAGLTINNTIGKFLGVGWAMINSIMLRVNLSP